MLLKRKEIFRENIEKEKKQKVAELLQRAKDYQKQQRYEEALGQLESLLMIDPINNEALAAETDAR